MTLLLEDAKKKSLLSRNRWACNNFCYDFVTLDLLDPTADYEKPSDIYAIGFEEIVDLNASNIMSARYFIIVTLLFPKLYIIIKLPHIYFLKIHANNLWLKFKIKKSDNL